MFTDETGCSVFLTMLIIGIIAGAVISGTASGVKAYNEGQRGWGLFGAIAGGAIVGGAMGAVMVLGGAAGLAATGVTIAGFGLSTGAALGISVAIGAVANVTSYFLVNGLQQDKSISLGGAMKSIISGALQAAFTFGAGYIGGKNGLFNKLSNFKTMDKFYLNMIKNTGRINSLSALFYGTSMLLGDTITKGLYLSLSAFGGRSLINWVLDKLPN